MNEQTGKQLALDIAAVLDAKKARKYLELFGEKKSLDVSMWLYDMAKLKADIFISGHTHVAALERVGRTIFLNPGSPSVSKREDGRSTFALMDEKHISIRDLYTGDILDGLPVE